MGGGGACVWGRGLYVCVWGGGGGVGWGCVIIFKRDNFVDNLLCIQPGNLEFNLKVVVDNKTLHKQVSIMKTDLF